MSQRPFEKPALSVPAHLALLKQRGMVVDDDTRAQHYLQFIGYYRLSGYWRPFQLHDGTANANNFRPGTHFETVLSHYVFDRHLRLNVMDAIERIEISARATILNTLSVKFGPHWYLERKHFHDGEKHEKFLGKIRKEAGLDPNHSKKRTDPIQHYLNRYNNPTEPACWMMFELLSFGTVSSLYANLKTEEQNSISNLYNLPHKRLRSWLHAASHLRNLCAHHSRVWNRRFDITPSYPRNVGPIPMPKRFYVHAIAIHSLLKCISGDSHWSERLAMLFDEYKSVNIAEMGFPKGWQQLPIWK